MSKPIGFGVVCYDPAEVSAVREIIAESDRLKAKATAKADAQRAILAEIDKIMAELAASNQESAFQDDMRRG